MLTESEQWLELVDWMRAKGLKGNVTVESRRRGDAGRGLFVTHTIPANTSLFTIPASALLNIKSLRPLYPDIPLEGFSFANTSSYPRSSSSLSQLNGTQLISLHLCIYRPGDASGGERSADPHFGPYISVMPREFESHPLTWLVKEEQSTATRWERQLLKNLTASTAADLIAVGKRFWSDWKTVSTCMADHAADLPEFVNKLSANVTVGKFLWAWLVVNTRCLSLRLFSRNFPLSNLTLCPIIDFANHVNSSSTSSNSYPQLMPVSESEIWGTSIPIPGKEVAMSFVSPGRSLNAGEEVYLKYGGHCNRTLFVEYGFVGMESGSDGLESPLGEADIHEIFEELLERKGNAARDVIKEILIKEGYNENLCLYSHPEPAHPSWPLLVALRLNSLDLPLNAGANPDHIGLDEVLRPWRNVVSGIEDQISNESEARVLDDLRQICDIVIARSEGGLKRLQDFSNGQCQTEDGEDAAPEWFEWSLENLRWLWEEERRVAASVLKNLKDGMKF